MDGQQQTRKKGKNSVEMLDRLSELPDPIIHHILSLTPTEYAVRTCVLSKKWRHHWTHVHTLNFKCYPYGRAHKFERFVRHVLRCRQPCKLRRLNFHGSRNLSFRNRVFNYALFHRVKELDTDIYDFPPRFPPRFPESQTLRTLKVKALYMLRLPSPFGFAALTTLQLERIVLASADIFSSCLKLEDLLLLNCSLEVEVFKISIRQLINLTISDLRLDYDYWVKGNRRNKKLVVITAPSLKVLYFSGMYPLPLSINKCNVLDKVSIQLYPSYDCLQNRDWKQECISDIQRKAEGLSYVKSLTISVEVCEISREKLISYSHHT